MISAPFHRDMPESLLNRRGCAGSFSQSRLSEIFVYCVLDCALGVPDPLLNLSLRVLRRSLRLELSVARRFSDAFFDLPGRLVGKTGNFIAGATHVFHPRHEQPAPLQSCNKRCIRTFRCEVRMDVARAPVSPSLTA